jgi:hypothetical protein
VGVGAEGEGAVHGVVDGARGVHEVEWPVE